jgi:fructokinase
VCVTLNDKGVAQYVFPYGVAWEHLEATDIALQAVHGAHAVCFGTLLQHNDVSRKTIQQLVAAASADALKIFDINLRLDLYSREVIEQSMRLSNVLKLNAEELTVLTGMFSLQGTVRQRFAWFVGTFGLKTVALTAGAQGSLIYYDSNWSEMPSHAVHRSGYSPSRILQKSSMRSRYGR